jgi:predicted transcriptional regulator
MVDLERLKRIIDDSGITMVAVAKKTGILRETLYNRLAGRGEFTVSEVESISEVFHLSGQERDDIFFAKQVE